MAPSDFPPRTIALMAGNDADRAVAELKRKRTDAKNSDDAIDATAALLMLVGRLEGAINKAREDIK